jgi:hypothetical protein
LQTGFSKTNPITKEQAENTFALNRDITVSSRILVRQTNRMIRMTLSSWVLIFAKG